MAGRKRGDGGAFWPNSEPCSTVRNLGTQGLHNQDFRVTSDRMDRRTFNHIERSRATHAG